MDIFGREPSESNRTATETKGWRHGLIPAGLVLCFLWYIGPKDPRPSRTEVIDVRELTSELREKSRSGYDEARDPFMQRLLEGGPSSLSEVGKPSGRPDPASAPTDQPTPKAKEGSEFAGLGEVIDGKFVLETPKTIEELASFFTSDDESWSRKLTARYYHEKYGRDPNPLRDASDIERWRNKARDYHFTHSDVGRARRSALSKSGGFGTAEEERWEKVVEAVFQKRLALAIEADKSYVPSPSTNRDPLGLDL